MVGLHEHTDGEPAVLLRDDPGRSPNAAFETVAGHTHPGSDAAFGDGSGSRGGQCL